MRKKLMKVAVIVGAVVVVLLIVLAFSLNGIVRKGVEVVGSKVLGVSVTLEKASVSALRGKVSLEGLVLGSPGGFEAEEMFRVGRVSVRAKISSLLGDEMVVKEVDIDAPEITLEIDGLRTNWGALLEGLEKEEAEEEKAEKKVRVDVIRFRDGKIKVSGVPLAGSAGIPLPSLEIKELKTADGTGVTVARLMRDVIRSLYRSILQAADKVLPTEQLEKLGKGVGLAIKDVGAAGAEKAKGLIKGIGEILPGKKE